MKRIGRPKGSGTKYEPKYCALLIGYFEKMSRKGLRKVFKLETETTGEKSSRKQEIGRICAELPTIEGFAISIKIPSTTVRQWAKDHEAFSVAYTRAKDIQRQLLVDRGLTRQYDPQAFAFVAKNITDMTDKQVIAGDPENPIAARLILIDAGREPKKP